MTNYPHRPGDVRRYRYYLEEKFGGTVRMIQLNSGFTCPNRDGLLGSRGCLFCDEGGGTGRTVPPGEVRRQISDELHRRQHHTGDRYVAYFQSFTNTYGPVDLLRERYEEALDFQEVVGIAVGTRPDCLPQEVIELLSEFAMRTWVAVGLGVQTLDDEMLRLLRRGHDSECSLDAIRRCRKAGLYVSSHLILGLPGQGPSDWLRSQDGVVSAGTSGIKYHMLYAAPGSELAGIMEAGSHWVMTREEYVNSLCLLLEDLPGHVVVERLCSSVRPPGSYIPEWLGADAPIAQAIYRRLKQRGTWQGIGPPRQVNP